MIYDDADDSKDVWFLNRGVVVVRARDPYAMWADSLDEDGPRFGDVGGWVNAYLIPDFELEEEAWQWVRENCSLIFELELNAWHTDPEAWPEDRSWKVFQYWFELEYIELAWDLVDVPLSSEAPPAGDGPRLLE